VILSSHVNTFGQAMLHRYGERVHKIAIDADFTCPNRDGSKGRGGCTFCNNVSFSPNGRQPAGIIEQIAAGRQVIRKRTGARKYLAYFQAYTNTYADIDSLRALYDQALSEPDVIGLAVGTRPDCAPAPVLDLLATSSRVTKSGWSWVCSPPSMNHSGVSIAGMVLLNIKQRCWLRENGACRYARI